MTQFSAGGPGRLHVQNSPPPPGLTLSTIHPSSESSASSLGGAPRLMAKVGLAPSEQYVTLCHSLKFAAQGKMLS
jgi:hypothetical protein